MRRRDALALGPALAASSAASQERARRVGYLRWDAADSAMAIDSVQIMRRRLGELGWIDGRNLALEIGWAALDPARAGSLVAAMLRGGAEIIVANGTPTVRAALAATREVPIVMAPAVNPLANGFVGSLARPGGNVTGVTTSGDEVVAKWLELLRDAIPGLARVALLASTRDPAAALYAAEARSAADALGLGVQVAMIDDPASVDDAIAAIARGGAQALLVQSILVFQRERIAEAAIRHRLPAISELRNFAEAGLLMAYGTATQYVAEAAAGYVDRILRGARAGDLPIDLPTRVELTINLRTARALGLALPPVVLNRADAVIE